MQFEVSTGSKFKPSKMTPYTIRIFWFSSLQLKKAHGQSLISEDIGGVSDGMQKHNYLNFKNTCTLFLKLGGFPKVKLAIS